MNNETKKSYATPGSKIALGLAILAFVLYLMNVAAGKMNIVYGLDLFQVGNVVEFLILLFASTAFIAAALLQEAAWKSNHESNT